ncbi:MAG: DUF4299 family protein, partial [Clostridia bacterium]|nr:DUF4299 family protein [Clostridia bacterium]
MAIEVVIKQKLFGSKTMPLEVILGERLCYGNFVNDRLRVDELGEEEFVAFNPESIGRGFSVIWNPNEKKTITLRLPIPSTTLELNDFYAAVERMVTYWGATLIVDGSRVSLKDFLLGLNDMVDFNDRTIKRISQEILDGEHDTLTLYSAKWPLVIGKEEATLFMDNSNYYAQWLHEKQELDVYFASPSFFADDHGIGAIYGLGSRVPAIYPYQPIVPFGTIDSRTGNQLECDEWSVILGVEGEEEPICEMEYSEFLRLIPENKKSKFDAAHFLLAEMTEEEIRTMATRYEMRTMATWYNEVATWLDHVLAQEIPNDVTAFCFNLYDDGN